MRTEWYCRIMGEEWGPMSAQELMAVARRGRLTRHDVVRRGANGTWVRAEIVRGLFSSSPPAPTATSDRVAIAPQQAMPAKRSLRPLGERKYWVKVGYKVGGPFTGMQLKQLAALGTLRPVHQISKDRCHWVRASQVKGLPFWGASSREETASIRSAVVFNSAPSLTGVEIADNVHTQPSEEVRFQYAQ